MMLDSLSDLIRDHRPAESHYRGSYWAYAGVSFVDHKRKGKKPISVKIMHLRLVDVTRYNGAALREIRKTHR